MRKHIITATKHLLLWIAIGVGTILFMIVAGEEDPANPMTLEKFFLLKFGALAGLFLLVGVCKKIYRAGLFPDSIYNEMEEEI